MTCIVAISDGSNVWMGADSAGSNGWEMMVRKDPKVFTRGEFTIGFTTSFRMGQLLRYGLNVPDRTEKQTTCEYMVTSFVPAARQCLKDGGWATKDKDQEVGGQFIVGYRGEIFFIDSDYQVAQVADPFYACGCGAMCALGSLHTTEGQKPKVRIENALRAAARFCAGVVAPFVFIEPEIKR